MVEKAHVFYVASSSSSSRHRDSIQEALPCSLHPFKDWKVQNSVVPPQTPQTFSHTVNVVTCSSKVGTMDKLLQTTALMTMVVLMLGVGPSAQDQSPSKTRANTDCLDGIPGFDIFLPKFCEEVYPWTTMESSCPPDTITPSHIPTTTSVPCPACDGSISVDDSVQGTIRRKWSSPNYPNNYPDG
ncbi:uncharacterized protein LOC143034689 [Oratosquilla oratoria]|uniref:uncharacterized protein LOC143034689 n=1 Tax=Oratosquilla oratoria TaxID=337810 RepID=UPI003F7676D8